ncbi:LuxR C-terminal-related transcriptional regulator [Sphingomonas sp. ST-64]|uniref:LuxR C-terminal-related transcriptional regulator n=1 Tax=Sphingomonas plantiphila TaxID=3163295 RepID=A0ABW8YHN6_9SPHN
MIRIVIAEDQALVLGAIASLLALEPDIEVVGRADNGAAALAMVRELAPDAAFAPADPLTERERAVLRLADEGRSNKEIGRSLSLSAGTVRNYLSEAAGKLGATNRIEASRLARERRWL